MTGTNDDTLRHTSGTAISDKDTIQYNANILFQNNQKRERETVRVD